MIDKTPPLESDFTYHIYNRANGNEKLFFVEENYQFFLDKFKLYVSPVADVFCYCLMPNHFHLLVRIKSEVVINQLYQSKGTLVKSESGETLPKFKTLVKLDVEKFVSKQFSKFFSSYAQSINNQQVRKGNLFIHIFKRKRIESSNYLMNSVQYIHHNPLLAGLCSSLESYKYSSYQSLITKGNTLLLRDETISWFGDLENFISVHKNKTNMEGVEFDY